MTLNENIIIAALSQGLKSESVQKIISVLGAYKMIEHEYDGTMAYHFQEHHIAIFLDENDLLIKVEIISDQPTNPVLQDITEKYANKDVIFQLLGQPNFIQTNAQLLAYDIKSHWIRFELEANKTKKIVYLDLSCVGMGYKKGDKVMRACKSSGKP